MGTYEQFSSKHNNAQWRDKPAWIAHMENVVHHAHDDVIKWKQFPRYWPFMLGFHRSPVNSPHKGRWRGALMFPLICVWINGWVNNRGADDLRRHRAHHDVNVMSSVVQSVLAYCGHWPGVQNKQIVFGATEANVEYWNVLANMGQLRLIYSQQVYKLWLYFLTYALSKSVLIQNPTKCYTL